MRRLILFFLFATFIPLINIAYAVPSFERQTGIPCLGCHYQYVPKLNALGREFKLGGFTAMPLEDQEENGSATIKDIGLLLIGRIDGGVRGQSSPPSTAYPPNNNGAWSLFDTAAIFLGGRLATDFGVLAEAGIQSYAPTQNNIKLVYSHKNGAVYSGISFYQTSELGAAYSMELFNTGAVANHRVFELGDAFMVGVRPGTGPGAFGTQSQGVSLFAGSPRFFANAGLFNPAADNASSGNKNTGLNMSQYYRLAYMPPIAIGLDPMIGFQAANGATSASDGSKIIYTSSWMVDGQMQGEVRGTLFEISFTFGAQPAGSVTKPNYFNAGSKDSSGLDLTAALGRTEGTLFGFGSYSNAGGGSGSFNALAVGYWRNIAQNISVTIETVIFSGDSGAVPYANGTGDATSSIFTLKLLAAY